MHNPSVMKGAGSFSEKNRHRQFVQVDVFALDDDLFARRVSYQLRRQQMIQRRLKLVDVLLVGSIQGEKGSLAGRKHAAQHRHGEILYVLEKQRRTLHVTGLANIGGDLILHVHRFLRSDQLALAFEKRNELAQIIKRHYWSPRPSSSVVRG